MEKRVAAFAELGVRINTLKAPFLEELAYRAGNENPWFTPENVSKAFSGLAILLDQDKLVQWTKPYSFSTPKRVGVVMAGNIPMVGFHDLLCILMAGHHAFAKLSSKDTVLMKYLIEQLISIEPAFDSVITLTERLNTAEAVIATGSDNTARYFEYYFRNIPHIIRKNRTSCGILMGEEPGELLRQLGEDVFSYFGLGCRNVSKLFVPTDYDLTHLLDSWASFQPIIQHHKYNNNYEYQKSIMLINQTPFLDTGFVMLHENQAIVSPISVVHYERFADQGDLSAKITRDQNKIQCIVSAEKWYAGSYRFGQAQYPLLTDYADQLDTMKFLEFRN